MIKKMIKNVIPYGIMKKLYSGEQIITRETPFTPTIYNRYGERMEMFYLQDHICGHSPYSFSSQTIAGSNYILWDRFNTALPIHFYSHKEMFQTKECKKKFGILVESEGIVPYDYDYVMDHEAYFKEFDGIFTHSARLLNKFENAHYIPGSSVWYGGNAGGGKMNPKQYCYKEKNVSIVSSNKEDCKLHTYRIEVARKMKKIKNVDVYGTIDGGNHVAICDTLEKYRYSIAIENYISDYYFTEKLLNCFAAMTIPIYIGAKKIDKFFNKDGIIYVEPFTPISEIEKIVKRCSKEDYEERKEAIIDNYNRVMEYLCIEDYMYKNYKEIITIG